MIFISWKLWTLCFQVDVKIEIVSRSNQWHSDEHRVSSFRDPVSREISANSYSMDKPFLDTNNFQVPVHKKNLGNQDRHLCERLYSGRWARSSSIQRNRERINDHERWESLKISRVNSPSTERLSPEPGLGDLCLSGGAMALLRAGVRGALIHW